MEVVDRFVYLGSCISGRGGGVGNEIEACISRARAVFANLGHLWRQRGILPKLEGRVCKTTVRAVLPYGNETWSLKVEDMNRLQVFDHRCLRSVAGIGWHQRVSNEGIRKQVFGSDCQTSSFVQSPRLRRLRWLGHVLRMPVSCLPHRALFADTATDRRKVRGGQIMTWRREMKSFTKGLATVVRVRLPGWGPRDSQSRWLETRDEIVADRAQWRECCRCLSELSVKKSEPNLKSPSPELSDSISIPGKLIFCSVVLTHLDESSSNNNRIDGVSNYVDDPPSPSWFDEVDQSSLLQDDHITPSAISSPQMPTKCMFGSMVNKSPTVRQKCTDDTPVSDKSSCQPGSFVSPSPTPYIGRKIPVTSRQDWSALTEVDAREQVLVPTSLIALIHKVCDIIEKLPMSKLLNCFGDQVVTVTQLLHER
ncbi:uncharacterized protein DEA37_0014625 [Paragonimus westermani]|uniref:Uncharacterized protein n=1 Tax=Paragonimus westermani TaxID=34504 RepID=A0A5J4NSA5_9TREM|nr:uncharacterized protein DEA37_0014625 [Paragonimus westermani]